jgi:hypothetical protein
MTVAIVLASIWLILHIIGFFLDIKGKVVPEIINIRGRIRRKKEEKKKQADLLERLEKKLESFDKHYSKDNIAKRNEWMKDVDNRAVTCGDQMTEMKDALLQVTEALKTNTKMTEDMFVENSRDRIIDFAEKVANPDYIVSHEQFRRIFRVYNEYESWLEEHNRTNGEVDMNYNIIQDAYAYRVNNHSFAEDLNKYKSQQND